MDCRSSTLLFLAFIFLFPIPTFGFSKGLTFNFLTFVSTDSSLVDTGKYGAINSGALQLTYDSASSTTTISNASGRIAYKTQLQLWHPGGTRAASFNTSFLLNMGPINGANDGNPTTGGGMAFVISSNSATDSDVEDSSGGFLGLFNMTTGNNSLDPKHRLFAVEFDTFKDSYDPDDNHVGIDTDSPISNATASLTPLNITLRTSSSNTSVWIDYDGRSTDLRVFVRAGTNVSKPDEPALSYSIDFTQYFPPKVYVGFSGSTGIQLETHCVLAWSFISEGVSPKKPPWLIPVVVLTVVAVVASVVCLIIGSRWWTSRTSDPIRLDPRNSAYGPRKFTYRELSKATKNFSNKRKLGKGGFGVVYKGTLADPINSAVAVKRISKKPTSRVQFIAEVNIMARIRHKNLVQLLGWSQQARKGQPLLVYEYMPNGDLSKWLHSEAKLDWEKRYRVMNGLAEGLFYLHEGGVTSIVHRDVKPNNVLLDGDFNAKLGDFGLAKLIENGDQVTGQVLGTLGYVAPEYISTGIVTKESDLFSFGIVGIEVATGCTPTPDFRRKLWQFLEENRLCDAADPRLGDVFQRDEMERLLAVSLACCDTDPASRPNIRQVQHALSTIASPLVVHRPAPVHLDPLIEFPSASSSSATTESASCSQPLTR